MFDSWWAFFAWTQWKLPLDDGRKTGTCRMDSGAHRTGDGLTAGLTDARSRSWNQVQVAGPALAKSYPCHRGGPWVGACLAWPRSPWLSTDCGPWSTVSPRLQRVWSLLPRGKERLDSRGSGTFPWGNQEEHPILSGQTQARGLFGQTIGNRLGYRKWIIFPQLQI